MKDDYFSHEVVFMVEVGGEHVGCGGEVYAVLPLQEVPMYAVSYRYGFSLLHGYVPLVYCDHVYCNGRGIPLVERQR